MDYDGGLDARDWMRHAPVEVVAMVRQTVAQKQKPRVLRWAMYRAQIVSDDELTTRVAVRCQDTTYANAFGEALLRAD
jgi:hypothetical protein